MKLTSFLKEKIITIILLLFSIMTINIFLLVYQVDLWIMIYILIIILLAYSIGIIGEYYQKKQYYQQLNDILDKLEQKYLINEIMRKPNFIEGEILKEVLKQTGKSMTEQVSQYRNNQEEYKEYIELWIHEIKLPIATSKMIVENNKNEITKSIEEELTKIEDYVEQALFYARSNNVEKDYCIKKTNLQDVIHTVIKKNKNCLLTERIKIELKDVKREVYTDSKWVVFILNQIIANSIKYRKKTPEDKITIKTKEEKDKTILSIQDNGLGIQASELSRVFEKGFTGTNGRLNGKKSTGIGLYLCKKLCNKLGLDILITSEDGSYTEVTIVFPKGSYMEIRE